MLYKKTEIIEAVVDFVKSHNFSEIKADLPGYNLPKKLVWTKTGDGYAPDVTAFKDNVLMLFSVQHPEDNVGKQLDKWRLFSSYASSKNRQCYIVSMVNQEFTIKNILSENRIQAKVLTVDTHTN